MQGCTDAAETVQRPGRRLPNALGCTGLGAGCDTDRGVPPLRSVDAPRCATSAGDTSLSPLRAGMRRTDRPRVPLRRRLSHLRRDAPFLAELSPIARNVSPLRVGRGDAPLRMRTARSNPTVSPCASGCTVEQRPQGTRVIVSPASPTRGDAPPLPPTMPLPQPSPPPRAGMHRLPSSPSGSSPGLALNAGMSPLRGANQRRAPHSHPTHGNRARCRARG